MCCCTLLHNGSRVVRRVAWLPPKVATMNNMKSQFPTSFPGSLFSPLSPSRSFSLSPSRGREEERPWQYSDFIGNSAIAFLRDFLRWSHEFSDYGQRNWPTSLLFTKTINNKQWPEFVPQIKDDSLSCLVMNLTLLHYNSAFCPFDFSHVFPWTIISPLLGLITMMIAEAGLCKSH